MKDWNVYFGFNLKCQPYLEIRCCNKDIFKNKKEFINKAKETALEHFKSYIEVEELGSK